jgi:hypothetical protein
MRTRAGKFDSNLNLCVRGKRFLTGLRPCALNLTGLRPCGLNLTGLRGCSLNLTELRIAG